MMPAMARLSGWWFVLLVTIGLAGCGGGDKVGSAPAVPAARLAVSSPAFAPGGRIPARFTCSGAGDRPALRFGGVPSGAKELALLVIDPDAGGFVHWTVYGMAPGVRGIASTGLPAGPPGPELDRQRELDAAVPADRHAPLPVRALLAALAVEAPAGADPQQVVGAIQGAAAGRGELVGRYGRG